MKRRAVKLDTKDRRAKLFLDVIGILMRYDDTEKRELALQAGVHWVTLYAWCSGKTNAPRIDTLVKVASALGFEIFLHRKTAGVVRGGLRLVK